MIIVECYSDTTLVQSLTSVPRQFIDHSRGRAGVCNHLSGRRDCKGLIDEDPGAPRHPYERAGVVQSEYLGEDIKLFSYPSQCNELIVLCPKLEDWILKTAQMAHINVTRHGLPGEAGTLHRVIDQRLGSFRTVLDMLKSQKSPRIATLARLLQIQT